MRCISSIWLSTNPHAYMQGVCVCVHTVVLRLAMDTLVLFPSLEVSAGKV